MASSDQEVIPLDNLVTIIVPSNLQANLTRYTYCRKGARYVWMHRHDGMVDRVKIRKVPSTIKWNDWFSIVEGVEAAMKSGLGKTRRDKPKR